MPDPAAGAGATASTAVLRHAPLLLAVTAGAVLRVVEGGPGPGGAVVGHLAGPAVATLAYLLLLRWGVSRWLAVPAVLPVLVHPAQLAAERLAPPTALVGVLVAAALLALCWHARPPAGAAALAGLLLAAAAGVAGPPAALLVPLAAAAVLAVLAAGPARERLRRVAALGAGAVAGLAVALAASAVGSTLLGPAVLGVELPRSPAGAAVPAGPGLTPLAGALLAACAAVALAAAAGAGRARRSGLRRACLALLLLPCAVPAGQLAAVQLAAVQLAGGAAPGDPTAGGALTPVLGSVLTAVLGMGMLPAAAALGLTALLRGARSAAAAAPADALDDVDRQALARFRREYGEPSLAPVAVVIAAYDEADGLPPVLSRLPERVAGLAVDVVVVDDGSSDGTAAAVARHGRGYALACPRNRGQGAALRLGYHLARRQGARYVVTTDADGQYDAEEVAVVLAPLLEGTADFVTGSRRLGRQHTDDPVRHLGVHVFAALVGLLTGRRLTDTSFGLRAMRAEVTAAVTLQQPQYQASELLIGAISRGFRVVEVPGTMHRRTAGSTKKGRNLVYGARYARVVLRTWWREGCPAPARERAPALRDGPEPGRP